MIIHRILQRVVQLPVGIAGIMAIGALTLNLGTKAIVASTVGTYDNGMITNLFNTGTNSKGKLQSTGSKSLTYKLVSAPSPMKTGSKKLEVYTYTVGWTANTADSEWITPLAGAYASNSPVSYGAVGTYDYQTDFNSTMAGAITITGNWASDNYGGSIEIDGVTVEEDVSPDTAFQLDPFAITGNIHAGVNTLDFLVYNESWIYGPDNPTGLQVEIESANVVPLSVPATGLLGLVGCLAFGGGLVLRRRMANNC